MLNFNACGGRVFVVVVLMLFSNSEVNTKSFSCQTNRIWKNIFIDNILTRIFSYSILKVNLCTSGTHTTAAKIRDECRFCYFELILFVASLPTFLQP